MYAPTNQADNNSAKPDGDATTNLKNGSVVKVHVEPAPLLFLNLHTGELIEVPKAEATAFENECRRMQVIAQNHLDANNKLALAYDNLSYLMANPMPAPLDLQRAQAAVQQARKEQQQAHQEVRQELEALGKINERDVKIMELIPLMQRSSGGLPVRDANGQPVQRIRGYKRTYVRSDKVKSHWRTYKLNKADVQSGHESILRKDANGKMKIDSKKLIDQIKEAKVKASWLKTILGDDHMPQVTGVLTNWAQEWNKDLNWNHDTKLGATPVDVSLSAQAQLMRYFAGADVGGEWEPMKGRVALKAEGRAEFAIAEGCAQCTLHFPSKAGLQLYLMDVYGKRQDIGPVRFEAGLKLTGTAGASIVGELAITTDFKDAKKGEWGIRGTPRGKSSAAQPDELDVGAKPKDPAANAELEVFAGVQADLALKGSLQWLHPQETGGKFQTLASVAPAVGGQVGIGAGINMELSYISGKFRFRVKAALCLGLGAKGRLELEVGPAQIWGFVKWFFYALYNVNYTNLTFLGKDTFKAINMLYFTAIAEKRALEQVMTEMISDAQIIREFIVILRKFEREQYRVQLMNNVLARPQLLLYSPPETRGMLLYQLTRHSSITKADLRNWDSFEVMSRRKRAVLIVIKSIQTVRDYENTLQHMHPEGGKAGGWKENEEHILRFLEIGLGDSSYDDEVRSYVKKLRLAELVLELHQEPARGYAVAYNDSLQYAMQADDHPLFACGGAIGVVGEYPTTATA